MRTKQIGIKWVIVNSKGVALDGEYDTKSQAEAGIRAIEKAQQNPVAKHDFNRGGFHKEKTKKDKLLDRKKVKRDLKRKDYD